MKKIGLLFSLATLLAFSSCNYVEKLSVEKRHYSKGYYVHVKGDRKMDQSKEIDNSTTNDVVENAAVDKNPMQSSPVIQNPETILAKAFDKTTSRPNKSKSLSQKQSVIPPAANKESLATKSKTVEKTNRQEGQPAASDLPQIIMVLLAIFLSPVAVYLKEGATTRFWIDLICWLLGVGVVGFVFYGGGLLLFAIIFALLIVLDVI